ncbi:MAG: hypothetical protein AAF547_22450 [Actinomycetota bacterium]
MSETTPTLLTSRVGEQLETVLAKPEPMCLLIVTVESEVEITSLVETRLRGNLRTYDRLWRIDEVSHAVMLRTLADANTLDSKLHHLFSFLTLPYPVDGSEITVRIRLGGAVRLPQDTASSLMERVGQALQTADETGCVGPVLL